MQDLTGWALFGEDEAIAGREAVREALDVVILTLLLTARARASGDWPQTIATELWWLADERLQARGLGKEVFQAATLDVERSLLEAAAKATVRLTDSGWKPK